MPVFVELLLNSNCLIVSRTVPSRPAVGVYGAWVHSSSCVSTVHCRSSFQLHGPLLQTQFKSHKKKAVTDPVHTRTTTATDHVKGTGAAVTDTVKGIEVAVVDMVHATIAAVNRPSSYYNSRW